ncbi:UDP-glucose 4-epimerase GalE [Janibacter cremeus]|uniref:UDP-glucose 4-epimerase GalE n=1 Tax=Janibacter cremeus TaxID=1285192 RepID=UPI0023F8EA60|nr:UDP-glucose 4-epimerase GalE [Janibacter cremeus]WEV78197.1 UDP-glucose 4-epimerase GalE [Janibacter cremeus]WEV78277.1 UDP-glucose 4-epimerase GalE [Janibacter cremeus]
MRVLVTGGAGYIGSHTVVRLVEDGHEPVILDSFVNSRPSVVPRLEELTGRTIETHSFDLRDVDKTNALLAEGRFDAVIHFAGLKAVGESSQIPLEYYDNNVGSTLVLARAMDRAGIPVLVFSSSATVYGELAPVPYVETHEPLASNNPYGRTKFVQEMLLRDVAAAGGPRVALLRYFNPVGAHPSGRIGEDPHGVPNNLMPFIAQVAVGRREQLQVFGDDYPTPDGTPQRDYLHVVDLAEGHVAALEYLRDHPEVAERAWNLGGGHGTSVLEMIAAFESASGQAIPYQVAPRRGGDLAAFWADASRAETELGWRAEHTIEQMCADTWRWQSANPQGYTD